MHRRILLVTDEMELGGTQRQLVELARSLTRASYAVSVAYFRNPSPLVVELANAGATVTCIAKRRRMDPVFFFNLCRFLRKGDFDIVHAFSLTGELWTCLANLVAGRARFISSIRAVYQWYTPFQWTLKRWVTTHSTALIANSHTGAEYAAMKMGIRRNRIEVVYNALGRGVEQRRREVTGRPRLLLFVGRLIATKNLPCLLRALALIPVHLNDWQLDIVGDGPERATTERLCRQLGLDSRVTFRGAQSQVAGYFARADIVVCTSHSEGLSNSIMEGMAAGCTVVATNVGGNSELIEHGVNGLLFPDDDHETLAELLAELLSDPQGGRPLGRKAIVAMRPFQDVDRLGREMTRIYDHCLVDETAWLAGR
ncbi:MAG: glycosyltransferase [Gammaproteobacteria bacterium]